MRRLLFASLLALVLLVPGLAHAADGSAYSDPALADELSELLRADWPNHFSAEEAALPPDSPIRAALWRARVAAKALPPLARGGSIESDASGRMTLRIRVTRRTPAGAVIDDRLLDFGPQPVVLALRSSAASALAAAPYGGIWRYFAGPLGVHPPDYPQYDVWYFYIRTAVGEVHAARDMPNCVWSTVRAPDVNCLQVGTNQIAAEWALYDSLLAQPVGQVLWNGRQCDPNYFPPFWDPINPIKCLTRLTTHDRFVRELPAAYFGDYDGRTVERNTSWTVPPTLDIDAARRSFDEEPVEVRDEVDRLIAPRRTLIFVPGVVGSELSLGALKLWPDAIVDPTAIPFLGLAGDGTTSLFDVRPDGILASAFTKPAYGGALDEFRSWVDTGVLSELVEYDYDFRVGVTQPAVELAQEIVQRCGSGPVWLAAHSTGGLVVKRALRIMRETLHVQPETCLGKGGVIFLAVPHAGAPKAIGSVINPDRFFSGIAKLTSSAHIWAPIVNDWSTVWQLMPRAGDSNVPAEAREAWFDDRLNGQGDRNVSGGYLNWSLDEAAAATGPADYPLAATVGSLPVINVFGYTSATPGSYAPGRCSKSLLTGVRRRVDLETDATLDGFVRGDETVPAWSAVWPNSGVRPESLYGVPLTAHKDIPSDETVLALIKVMLLRREPLPYPDWPMSSILHLRAEAALATLGYPLGRTGAWETHFCSPVSVMAEYNGGKLGHEFDGTRLDSIPDALLDIGTGPDGKHQTFVIPQGEASERPEFRLTATGAGPVSVWHTDPDGSEHDFMFEVTARDQAIMRYREGGWHLDVDRGGDGDVDETLVANHPVAGIALPDAGDAFAGEAFELTARAAAQIGGELEFDWSLISGDGELTGAGDHASFVPRDGPQTVRIRLTVKDTRGNRTQAEVTFDAKNRPPVADAGQDLSAPWGVPIAFNGLATDAAPDLAAGLALRWDFGDGSGADGPAHLHTYSEPRAYQATLTATDRDGAAGSDIVAVNVLKRQAELSADRLVAPFGSRTFTLRVSDTVSASTARLEGRTIRVELDGVEHEVVAAADGTATLTLPAPLAPGAHPLRVSLAQDGLYEAEPLVETLRLVNGFGDVEGAARYDTTAHAAFTVHSDADRLTGQLQYRSADRIRLHSDQITGFGIVDGAAWFSGVATDGRRFVARAEPGSFSLWIDGQLEPGATVDAGAIHVRPG